MSVSLDDEGDEDEKREGGKKGPKEEPPRRGRGEADWERLDRARQSAWDIFMSGPYTTQTVGDLIGAWMAFRQMNSAQVAHRAHVSHGYLSQIITGKRHASRDTLICIAFGLLLDRHEASDLLERGDWSRLREDVRRDWAIAWHLDQRSDLTRCDEVLHELGEPLLGSYGSTTE